jgi:hypothetical protein
MKTTCTLLLSLLAVIAEAQVARPLPPEVIPGGVPAEPPVPEEPMNVDEFLGSGRYQILTAQMTVDGRERTVVFRLDTATGRAWSLEAIPNPGPGRPAFRFVDVQDNLPRPRPGFPGGFPGSAPGGIGIEAHPVQPELPPSPPPRRPDPNR